ncbi:PrsW family glutamic-type intramembrane protease [Pontiella sp.]|uniref:PrsW family glutamic-type intramembrane protease n=1 Tax=Pontiella sp. TaxID=2837462 RepID=UPI0035629356
MDKRKLYRLTRRTGFLWKSAGLLAGVLVALGIAISFLNTERLEIFEKPMSSSVVLGEFSDELDGLLPDESTGQALAEAIGKALERDRPFHEKLLDIQYLLYFAEPQNPVAFSGTDALGSNETAVVEAFLAATSGQKPIEPLKTMAETQSAPPFANYALALAYELAQDDPAAVEALRREILLHGSDPARERLVDTFLDLSDSTALEELAADPDFAPFITPYVRQEIALDKMDWPEILQTHFSAAYENTNGAMVLLALLSGGVWATVLFRFNGSRSVWPLALPALLLGALSAHATLLFIYWQEYQLGFEMGEGLVQQLIYCVLGIGLREEALKLLLFVPLIPLLLRRTDLEILTVAGLVGLGFAIEENIGYFTGSAGTSALGRFVTANFLHIALTAMCGLTLVRALVHRGEDIGHAANTFAMAVAIHGLYDAFLMVYAFSDYSFLAMTVFVLMGYQYFGWLRHLRDEWRDPVSITFAFTLGVVFVTGLSFALYAWDVGPSRAFQSIGFEVIGVAIILIMFYREIPETLE